MKNGTSLLFYFTFDFNEAEYFRYVNGHLDFLGH